MAKEMIYIDFTKGYKQFDTSKMSEWTSEEWKEWTAEPDDNLGIHKVLFDDPEFYFKMTSLYYDEASNDMYVTFDAQNKTNRDYSIRFGKWKVDEQEFDLSNSTPTTLGNKSEIIHLKESVKSGFLKSMISMEVNIIDVNRRARELVFILKIYSIY
ncbi:hypothetical protein H9649_02680 [Sporosarcina sp. Sa2YVA2]|uniref:Uncharacterized protein n=1 Tax=Sporosarcina quadrami TaxID=2762234 RepID=A0ABR8U7I7_9BACL|nr:hypothetical protein [Sporosarcina quadrami]MBD7983474.1 hypothetical protein [Sporosarcina quadrami]